MSSRARRGRASGRFGSQLRDLGEGLDTFLRVLAVRTLRRLADRLCTGDQPGDCLRRIHPHVPIDDGHGDTGQGRGRVGTKLVLPDDVVSRRVWFVEEPAIRGAVIDLLVHPLDGVVIRGGERVRGKVAVRDDVGTVVHLGYPLTLDISNRPYLDPSGSGGRLSECDQVDGHPDENENDYNNAERTGLPPRDHSPHDTSAPGIGASAIRIFRLRSRQGVGRTATSCFVERAFTDSMCRRRDTTTSSERRMLPRDTIRP